LELVTDLVVDQPVVVGLREDRLGRSRGHVRRASDHPNNRLVYAEHVAAMVAMRATD
jgi:hypothetical protein